MTVFRSVSQGIGAQIIIFILATDTIGGPGQGVFPTRDAYCNTFAVVGLTGVLASLVALALPRARQPQLAAEH